MIALLQGLWAWRTPAVTPERPQPVSRLFRAMRTPHVATGIWFVLLPGVLFGTLGVLAPVRLYELGFGALAIGATWLTSAACEAFVSPTVGHLSDRVGRTLPLRYGLAASAIVLLILPWPSNRYVLAFVVVCAGISFGTFWTPAMSMLSDAAEEQELDYGYGMALINLAWAPGQAAGAAARREGRRRDGRRRPLPDALRAVRAYACRSVAIEKLLIANRGEIAVSVSSAPAAHRAHSNSRAVMVMGTCC